MFKLGGKLSVTYNQKKLDSKFPEIFTWHFPSLPSHCFFIATVAPFLAEWNGKLGIWTIGGVERRGSVIMLETKSSIYHFAECQPKPSLGSSKDPSHPMKLRWECTVIHYLASSKDLHSRWQALQKMSSWGEKEVLGKITGLWHSLNLSCSQALHNARPPIESVKGNTICVLLERI